MNAYRTFGLLVVISLLLTACGSATPTATPDANALPPVVSNALVISEGRLYPQQYADIAFNSSGNVAEVLAKEGETVTADQVIARLVNTEAEEATVAHAQKAADVARAQQEVVAAQQEVAAAQQALLDAQAEAVNARKAITDMLASTATGLNLAQAEMNIADLRKQIDDAERNLRNLASPDVQYYRDQLARAQDALTMTTQTASMTDLQIAVTLAQESKDQRAIELQYVLAREGWGGANPALEAQKNYDIAVDTLKNAQLRLEQAQISNGNSYDDAAKALDKAQKNLNSVLKGPDAVKLAKAQADVELLKAQLLKAQSDAEKLKTNSGVDQDKLKAAQDRVNTADASLVSGQAHLATAEARVTTAQASLVAAEMKQDSIELKAPFAGTVTVQNLKVGEHVTAGQPMTTLADASKWEIKTDDLTEIEVVKIKTGQAVTVKLDALPDVKLTGVVKAISAKYEEKRGDITYTVTIALTSTDPQMRWGMTAEVTFEK
jgi:multidrug efflux pump subunit AcrA (membrane-fusion protein)